jgi:hypothetical protein
MYFIKVFAVDGSLLLLKSPRNVCFTCCLADSIVKYVRSLVRPLSTELNTAEELENFRDHPDGCVIGMFCICCE